MEEEIIRKSLENFDRAVNMLNLCIGIMGNTISLFTLVVIILGAILGLLGFNEYRRWVSIRKQAEEKLKEAEKMSEEAKKHLEEVKRVSEEAKIFFERIKKFEEEAKEMRDNILKQYQQIEGKIPKDLKAKISELSERLRFLEAFGTPLKAEDYYVRGLNFYYKGDYNLALKSFEKAIELKPDYAEAWYNKGLILMRLRKDKEALESFEKAINLKPNYVKAWNNKGVVLKRLMRYDEALEAFKKALELDKNNTTSLYNIACVYSLKGDKEKALEYLKKAIELKPKRYKEKAKEDQDFKNLWDDEDFKKLTQ
jgi:tetratricopeptide (TPR) repeat protein